MAFHEHNLLPFSTPESYALQSAESKATEAANNEERLVVCDYIVWCRTILCTRGGYFFKIQQTVHKTTFYSGPPSVFNPWASGHHAIIAAMQVACDRALKAALGGLDDKVRVRLCGSANLIVP